MAATATATLSLATLLLLSFSVHGFPPRTFNVLFYGARGDGNGNGDNAKAFLAAWDDACAYYGRGRVLVPPGTYELGSVTFTGHCNGAVSFIIKGTLRAPSDPQLFFTDTWIGFQYVERLTVKGGGYLDGQGPSAWKYNDCNKNFNCKTLPATIRLDFVNESWIHNLRSINSKNTHISLFACNNITISNVRLDAPADSPNTDGVHIGSSSDVRILRSAISTGDDCVGMVSGSTRVEIAGVACGPGHGISIGSLGRSHADEGVRAITVRNTTFHGTSNGVRIKTWAPSERSVAEGIVFEDINMRDVMNPIVIDQRYCPLRRCLVGESEVQIQDVVFRNIWGTSRSEVAVNLKCSRAWPCKNVRMENIALVYNGREGKALASCVNVEGSSVGRQIPSGCV